MLISVLFILSIPSKNTLEKEAILWLIFLFFILPSLYLYNTLKRAVILGFYLFAVICWTDYAQKNQLNILKQINIV